MVNTTQLPYLIKLLDDESPIVRDAVQKELSSFGPSLEDELNRLSIPMDDKQKKILQKILVRHHQKWLVHVWPQWLKQSGEKEQLEYALGLLAEYQYAKSPPAKLTDLLDHLANAFLARGLPKNVLKLNAFLFKEMNFKGAQTDYFNPWNSNPIYTIQNKRGIPITLACIYILVGHRLGLEIEGCNYPGHFLARIIFQDRILLVDCYHGGRLVDGNEIINMHPEASKSAIKEIIEKPANTLAIICRVLRNLMRAYHEQSDHENHQLMSQLYKDLPPHLSPHSE